MQEHKRMNRILWNNPSILQDALGLEKVWIRCEEYKMCPVNDDMADLVFQDKFNPFKVIPDTTCFVVELKSDFADHEVVGQLKKSVLLLKRIGDATGHWNKVEGLAIAKDYTSTGLTLLMDEGFRAFSWSESNAKVRLIEKKDERYKKFG